MCPGLAVAWVVLRTEPISNDATIFYRVTRHQSGHRRGRAPPMPCANELVSLRVQVAYMGTGVHRDSARLMQWAAGAHAVVHQLPLAQPLLSDPTLAQVEKERLRRVLSAVAFSGGGGGGGICVLLILPLLSDDDDCAPPLTVGSGLRSRHGAPHVGAYDEVARALGLAELFSEAGIVSAWRLVPLRRAADRKYGLVHATRWLCEQRPAVRSFLSMRQRLRPLWTSCSIQRGVQRATFNARATRNLHRAGALAAARAAR
jgi:hypothetical protein